MSSSSTPLPDLTEGAAGNGSGVPGAGGTPVGAGGTPNAPTNDAGSAGSSTTNSGGMTPSGGAGGRENPGPTGMPSDGASGPLLAFPGAEGFGRNATGGRGGEIYHVTNLDDSGAGSFRDAVSEPNRIVVFDVGGIIDIGERVVIHSNITVAGQTAPGGGITIYGNGVALNGDSGGGNVILRYFRIRMGQNGDSEKDAVSISLGDNYMFDHMSMSWGRDGTLDVNGTPLDNLSFQDCIISQGINSDNHSTGGLMQPSGVEGRWSMIRSLFIDNKTRNPKARGRHEFINSVIYNWAEHGYIMGDTTNGESHANVIGNYLIYGPSSNADSHITGTTEYFHLYAEDNFIDSNKNGTLDGSLLTDFKTATVESTPYDYPGVNDLLSAEDALNHVIENVGASIARDAVDEMLIEQLRSFGTEGQIIDTEADNGIPGNVGTVAGGTVPTDTDRDGMPDAWETARGLDPNAADDSGDDDGDGYTNVEEYLSCLVAPGGC
jgi:pectate lyase